MKKIICILLILSFALPLVSCNKAKAFINGVSIKDFSIVYSDEDEDYAKRAAEYIQSQIKEKTGHSIDIVEDNDKKTDHEIVVGDTNRAISEKLNADTEGLEFAIMADESSVALEGDYFIIAAAAYFFIETYIPGGDHKATVPKEVCVHKPIVKEAKNFILLIGDGMGYYQTKMFDYMENDVEFGDGEDLFYGELLPYSGYSRTDSLSGTTDSAAGGTALACGIKTYNKYIGMDKNGKSVQSLTELAHKFGKSTGVMSTESNTGATPSTFSAHCLSRDNTTELIASQRKTIIECRTVIDCGYDYYTPKYMVTIEKHITDTLNTLSANKNGFFLMYEEAHIDKHGHDMKVDKAFEAVVRFNQAIARFMEFAFYNPNTFILITADHETGGLHVNENGALEFACGDHTSENVPVFVYGVGGNLFNGLTVENIQIAHTIAAMMGENDFGDQSEYKSLTKG